MTITVSMPIELMPYLDSIYVKTLSTTLNNLVEHFRQNSIQIVSKGRRLGDIEKHTIALNDENTAYINANKVASKAFTVVCIVATAKELDIRI